MNRRKIGFFSALFGLLGLCLAAAGIVLAVSNRDAGPVLVEQPDAAMEQVETMMDALCTGDYDTVSGCIYGNPDLGLDREADGEVAQLFWNALAESFDCQIRSDFHATNSGVSLDVTISAMDIKSVTANLRERAQGRMEQRIEQTDDLSEIYDENHEYREEFVMEALLEAAKDALAQDAQTISWDLTLNLIYENGQWWIMPETELFKAISGGILS